MLKERATTATVGVPDDHCASFNDLSAALLGIGGALIVIAIVATGAGLHVAAYFLEHASHIGLLATVLSVAVPVALFLALIYGQAA
jgi:hypothetical protein